MKNVSFGVVGTGFIGGVVADAIVASDRADLVAVSSRKLATAEDFVAERPGAHAVEGVDALLSRHDIDAVYVATPTTTKEAIALAAIRAGKHVLVDKPLSSAASVKRMTDAAAKAGVIFMDATHFVHHPRTAAIRAAIPERIGKPKSLHTTFYFPFTDRQNIRFDETQEPMGAIGDMGWYSMRAAVEYLQPSGDIASVSVAPEFDAGTGAVIRASGLVQFAAGETCTFDIGYTAGAAIMDLSLLGTKGMITMDDFVLDWHNSFAFKNPEIRLGYTHRAGMAARDAFVFIETPTNVPADQHMIETFAKLVTTGAASEAARPAADSLRTQVFLDAIWDAVQTHRSR